MSLSSPAENSTEHSPIPLWLALRFPRLSLDILPQRQHTPVVIVDGHKVYLANDTAQKLGIVSGTSVHTALLLSQTDTERNLCETNSLTVHAYCPEKERRAMQRLAQWAYQFTPYISLWNQQHSLLLELSTCLKLFGGIEALLNQIRGSLNERNLTAIASLAHTPKAAWLLGWQSECNSLNKSWQLEDVSHCSTDTKNAFVQRLNNIPLKQLPVFPPFTEKLSQQLQNIGFKTLGNLLALPRNSIARRYGKQCLKKLDQITGLTPDLQIYTAPAEHFSGERHFLRGLDTIATLSPPMQELLKEFQIFLRARQLQAEAFHWDFLHFDKSHSQIHVELASAQTRSDTFFQITQLRLQKHRISSPIETITLYCNALKRATMHNHLLFADYGDHNAATSEAGTLLDTLTSRLGANSIYQLQALDDHLPEGRQGFGPVLPQKYPATHAVSQASDKKLPLWFFPQPRPLPTHRRNKMTLLSGARRIDSHWWQQRQQRDYFIARDLYGCHWVFFDHGQERWFIHGHYG